MKHFLRVAILVIMVALFLSAWSLPTGAASRATSTNGRVALAALAFAWELVYWNLLGFRA